jgi:hypothetical protein
VRHETSIDPIDLPKPMLTPLALILNECVNNALEHGFPGDTHGVIIVRLQTRSDEQGARRLTIADDGRGPPEGFNSATARSSGLAATLEAELERIAALGLDDLRSLWLRIAQNSAPRAFSRDLLARMIAYRVQEQRLGKLGREMRQRLDRLAKGGGEPVRHLKVGTVMVREHEGTLHEVMVVPTGFSWRDKTYPSLSAIALTITGTSWNGPRFFGLRGGKSGMEPPVATLPVEKVPPRSSTRGSVRSISAAAAGKVAHGREEVHP